MRMLRRWAVDRISNLNEYDIFVRSTQENIIVNLGDIHQEGWLILSILARAGFQ